MLFDRLAMADIELRSGEILRVRDLRIEFQIRKSRTSDANAAEIRVSNLSRETRAKIRERDVFVRLYAGYTTDMVGLIFSGYANLVVHRHETPDIVTNIEAQDGSKPLREVRVKLSYGRVMAKEVIETLAKKLKIPLKQGFAIPGEYPSFSFNGRAKDALDDVTRRFGYDWSVLDNELQVLPRRGNNGKIVYLSAETGLVNYPERLFDQEGEFDAALDKELVWKVTSLLNPRLLPGSLLAVDSGEAKGQFQIEQVRHYGDTRGNDFYSEVELRAP